MTPRDVNDEKSDQAGAGAGATRTLSDLTTPAFVVNRHAFVSNCERIRLRLARSGVRRIRPHVKTHKTKEGAYIQAFGRPPPPPSPAATPIVPSREPPERDRRDEGGEELRPEVGGFVASTVPEVSMLLDAADEYGSRDPASPFRDILYGVPIDQSRLKRIDALREDLWRRRGGGNIHVLVDHERQLDMLERYAATASSGPFTAFVKLDTGYGRAGVPCDGRGIDLAERLHKSRHVALRGVYSHCGHAYDTNDADELDSIAREDLASVGRFLSGLERRLASSGRGETAKAVVDRLDVSVGSTPSLLHHRAGCLGRSNRLEAHPGNYTLYDRQQLWSGAAESESDLAGRVLARVIGHYPDRGTIMLDAGATALTKDSSPQGGVCAIPGRPDLECYKMSQEVTLVRTAEGNDGAEARPPFPFEDFPLGSTVSLLPNHSCLVAACFDRYYVIDDPSCDFGPDEAVVDEWIPAKGW